MSDTPKADAAAIPVKPPTGKLMVPLEHCRRQERDISKLRIELAKANAAIAELRKRAELAELMFQSMQESESIRNGDLIEECDALRDRIRELQPKIEPFDTIP